MDYGVVPAVRADEVAVIVIILGGRLTVEVVRAGGGGITGLVR